MTKQRVLFVVAHADDEAIFFAGTIARNRRHEVHLVCVTQPVKASERILSFKKLQKSAQLLGVARVHQFDFLDHSERLPVDSVSDRLKSLGDFDRIFTHGIAGEYGHPHHQIVSYSVHQAFSNQAKKRRVYSLSKFEIPDLRIMLSEEEFALKMKLVMSLYVLDVVGYKEKVPFLWVEGFSTKTFPEISRDFPVVGTNPSRLGRVRER
ncbi:MAG: PIG-L family deacetylase [Bdellovibrionales bacterium]|nr:PIG-L family deacetylase [Bdellovibrionales bacterium]